MGDGRNSRVQMMRTNRITPCPGAFGSKIRRKGHLSIFNPSMFAIFTLSFQPSMTIRELYNSAKLKFKLESIEQFSLEMSNNILGRESYETELKDLQIDEYSLLKIEFHSSVKLPQEIMNQLQDKKTNSYREPRNEQFRSDVLLASPIRKKFKSPDSELNSLGSSIIKPESVDLRSSSVIRSRNRDRTPLGSKSYLTSNQTVASSSSYIYTPRDHSIGASRIPKQSSLRGRQLWQTASTTASISQSSSDETARTAGITFQTLAKHCLTCQQTTATCSCLEIVEDVTPGVIKSSDVNTKDMKVRMKSQSILSAIKNGDESVVDKANAPSPWDIDFSGYQIPDSNILQGQSKISPR